MRETYAAGEVIRFNPSKNICTIAVSSSPLDLEIKSSAWHCGITEAMEGTVHAIALTELHQPLRIAWRADCGDGDRKLSPHHNP